MTDKIKFRAKFEVDSIERRAHKDYNDAGDYEIGELHTIKLSPVTPPNGAANHENARFWRWTPCGQIELGTVNADVVEGLKPGMQLYVDFTEA